ncbi:conserved hypothetical protein [Desulfovibrionales bacterium]
MRISRYECSTTGLGRPSVRSRTPRAWTWLILFSVVGLLVVLLVGAGCKARQNIFPGLFARDPQQFYALALADYIAGNYHDAIRRFHKLAETVIDLKLRRKVFFGLACASLAAADSDESHRDALVHWHNWLRLLPINPELEDPRLLTTLLSRLRLPILDEDRPSGQLSFAADKDPCVSYRVARDLSKLKKELKQKADESMLLREQLSALQNQLNNLECLHHEIEQRKKKVE